MLKSLRRHLGNLISGGSGVETIEDAPTQAELAEAQRQREARELAQVAQAEAKRREQRLILSERVHNQTATHMGELRNKLLYRVQDELETPAVQPNLNDLLDRLVSDDFDREMNTLIRSFVDQLSQRLQESFSNDENAARLFPEPDRLDSELRDYRDQLLRTHILEQIEVLAMPTLSHVFPSGGNADSMKQGIANYWEACRKALAEFVDSDDMTRLTESRPGLRLEASELIERLVTAQYRNGYRTLNERYRTLYSQIIEKQMRNDYDDEVKAKSDRQVVDDIVIPLAFFVRSRTDTEPRDALAERVDLLRDIVDKLVAVPDNFPHTAEALKPVIRRSIEQALPGAMRSFPYLRPALTSLVPGEVHRTTALLRLFETLVRKELDESVLEDVEQIIRTNRAQYNLFVHLLRSYPELVSEFKPFERYAEDDARMIVILIEQTMPDPEMIRDLGIRLRYLTEDSELPDDSKSLLRAVARIMATANEMTGWRFLYGNAETTEQERRLLARHAHSRLKPTSIGVDERQSRVSAIPHPLDLNKVLGRIGYRSEEKDRSHRFGKDLEAWITKGDRDSLTQALSWLRKLLAGIETEREAEGLLVLDAAPYGVEIWMNEARELVGLIQLSHTGYGPLPVEMVVRDGGDDEQTARKELGRRLLSRACIYQTFYAAFSQRDELPREKRRTLPGYVKLSYEPAEPNRGLLKTRCKSTVELVERIRGYGGLVGDVIPEGEKQLKALRQVCDGLVKRLSETIHRLDQDSSDDGLQRALRDYNRVIQYVNTVVLHSVNPWLEYHTKSLSTEVDFDKDAVARVVAEKTKELGIDWDRDVIGLEAHPVRGTLSCRSLLKLADGSSKVVLLEYIRRERQWHVGHIGPRISDVVRDQLKQAGKKLPDDYDQKYENHSFGLDEQSCRFMLAKGDDFRVEATLVLRGDQPEHPWQVVYLKHRNSVLLDEPAHREVTANGG